MSLFKPKTKMSLFKPKTRVPLFKPKKLKLEDLKIGMKVKPSQLSEIYETYIMILYDNQKQKKGKIVYIGKYRTEEYSKWYRQDKPIRPVYNYRD